MNAPPRAWGWAAALSWPLAYLGVTSAARAYKLRVLSLQDLAVAALFGLVVHALLRRGATPAGGPARGAWLGACLAFALALGATLLGFVITGLLSLPVTLKLALQGPSLIFVRTALNADAVASSLGKLVLLGLGAPLLLAIGSAWLEQRARLPRRPAPWPLCLAVLSLFAASPWLSFDARHRDTNLLVTLPASALRLGLTREPPRPRLGPAGFASIAVLDSSEVPAPAPLAALRFGGTSYDVCVVVLETGVAEVMQLEEPDPRWLPNLRALTRRALVGRRHLAPFPGSTKSIFALVAGRYPFPDFRNLIRTRPDAPCASFPQLLAAQGYRSAAFASIDGDYDRMDAFLGAHGFAHLADRASLGLSPLPDPTFGSDAELYAHLRSWLAEDPTRPSLSLLLPSNSHWPFFCPPDERVFPADASLPRYRNALQHQDRLLGDHVAWLESSGRLARTVLVVVADHGAYFDLPGLGTGDPAGLLSHHVPFLLLHPRLDAPLQLDFATSHVDLAPTLLEMLSETPPPPAWQGRSLLRSRPLRRLVFFSQDYSEGHVGASDGEQVLRWNRGSDVFQAWDWEGVSRHVPRDAPPEALRARLRTYFAHQSHALGELLSDWQRVSGD